MMRTTCFALVATLLLLGIASQSEAYTYHWEIDETIEGSERATLIEPIKVVLKDEVVDVVPHSSALFLLQKYSVHLDGEWSNQQAYALFQTFESIPQEKNDPYGTSPNVPASVWRLSASHIQNDIEIKTRGGQQTVTIAVGAFTYAKPLLAEIEGVQGRFFSKRLHRAVVRFVTNNGKDRQALERILQERYAVSLDVQDYAALTRYTTRESASRFTKFKDEELIAIASMLEEFPQGMLHTPGLNYLIRRLDGTPHPLYPAAPAVAWPTEGYIEFMESAFKDANPADIHRLILHEKAHFLWEHLFDEQLKQDWIELGGWYRISEGIPQDAEADASSACEEATDSLLSLFDCFDLSAGSAVPDEADDWATTKQTEFVSAYAHAHNPNEDMAESIAFYIVNPDKLRSRAPGKYEFIQNRIMHGTRYISQIRSDLTFEVYNLYPDVVYPGRIIRVDIQVDGKPEEDKELTIEIQIHSEGYQDDAQASLLRIFSKTGSFFDIWLNPYTKWGTYATSGYVLRGQKTISKYAANGYWRVDQITLRDAQGNERHESQTDFGWKLYLDNPLADDEAPIYVKNSMKLSLSEAFEDNRSYQVITARWKLIEESGMNGVLARLNDADPKTYSRRSEDWGRYDSSTGEAIVAMKIPDYYPSGLWELNYIIMKDVGLNSRGVYFTHPGYGLKDDQEVVDEQPASIEVKTTNPDTVPPELDLNKITIQAEPTNPSAPNGETKVDITFRVKDDNSGYEITDMLLRDPQGTEHHYRHHRYDWDKVYFTGDATAYEAYEHTIILPEGSIPGTWGLASMVVRDKAQNRFNADFTEIVRFEVASGAGKPVTTQAMQLQQNAPNPFNSQTVIAYTLPEPSSVQVDVFALTGQRVTVLRQGRQPAGHYRLRWDGRDRQGQPVASGVYLYRLATPEGVLVRKLTLLR